MEEKVKLINSDYIKRHKQVFKGATDIDYLFVPSDLETNYLIVGFSAFAGERERWTGSRFNYIEQTNRINAHRLFIDDYYEGLPCYYLGKSGSEDYSVSVGALIFKIANENKIIKKNIITIGSSKGGSGALYTAIKYNLGYTFPGGFQTRPGSYVKLQSKSKKPFFDEILSFVSGHAEEDNYLDMDNMFLEVVSKRNIKTKIHIHIGKGDWHFENMKLLLNYYKNNNIKYQIDIADYESHSDLGVQYPIFLNKVLPELCGTTIELKPELIYEEGKIKFILENWKDIYEETQFAFYLYDGESNIIEKKGYQSEFNFVRECNVSGRYRGYVHIKNRGGIRKVTTNTVDVK